MKMHYSYNMYPVCNAPLKMHQDTTVNLENVTCVRCQKVISIVQDKAAEKKGYGFVVENDNELYPLAVDQAFDFLGVNK